MRCSVFIDFHRGDEYFPGSFLVDGDVLGYEFAGWYGSSGETTDVMYVDGTGYVRAPPADWTQPVGFELAIEPNPFWWLTESDIIHVSSGPRVGVRMHELRADWFVDAESMTDADWLGPEMAWTEMRDISLESSDFPFYIRDDGMPSEATLRLELVGSSLAMDARLVILFTYIFSRHGVEVTIVAPRVNDAI